MNQKIIQPQKIKQESSDNEDKRTIQSSSKLLQNV